MKYRFLAVESLPFHRIKSKVNKLENFLLLWPNYCIFNVRYFEQDILQLLFFFFISNCHFHIIILSVQCKNKVGKVLKKKSQVFSSQEYVNSQSQKPVPAPLSLEQALLPAILPSRYRFSGGWEKRRQVGVCLLF